MKICNKCNLEKDLSEFDKRENNRIINYCKDCRRAKLKKHYSDNKQYYILKAKNRRPLVAEKYNTYKKTLSCNDCSLSFKNEPYLCDFHHLDGKDKEYSIGNLRDSFKKFLKEIEKCIPLCANCHRRRHYKQN